MWYVVAAQSHVPVLMVEVDSSCMSVSYKVDECIFTYGFGSNLSASALSQLSSIGMQDSNVSLLVVTVFNMSLRRSEVVTSLTHVHNSLVISVCMNGVSWLPV